MIFETEKCSCKENVFSLQVCVKHLILRWTEREMFKNLYGSLIKLPIIRV